MAAPVVAGAAALLLQKDPTLTPDTVKARLMLSAPTSGPTPNGSHRPLHLRRGLSGHPGGARQHRHGQNLRAQPRLAARGAGNLSLLVSGIVGANQLYWGTIASPSVIWGGNITWGVNIKSGAQSAAQSTVWNDHITWGSSSGAVDLTSVAVNGE